MIGAFQFTWPLPLWAVLLLAVALGGLSVLTYRVRSSLSWPRQAVLVGLRMLTLLALLAMLGAIAWKRYAFQKAELVILIDDSASMDAPQSRSVEGRTASARSRVQSAVDLLSNEPRRLKRWQDNFEMRLERLSGSPARIESSGGVDFPEHAAPLSRSPLGGWLIETLAGQRGRGTAAVVLLSDGIVTEGKSLKVAGEYARSQAVPLVVVGMGDEQPSLDIAIEEVLADRWALVGDRVELQTLLSFGGVEDGQAITVQLIDQADQSVLDQQTILAASVAQTRPVTLAVNATRARVANLVVVAKPLSGESNTENNRFEKSIEFRDEQLKVLFVQDQPSYEFRYLKHLLERVRNQAATTLPTPVGQGRAVDDAAKPLIDLVTVLQSGDARYAQQDRSAVILPPVGLQRLAEFDVVILSDAAIALLGDVFLTQLAKVVSQRGVGLVVIAGPRHFPAELVATPIEPLLPVEVSTILPPEDTAALTRIQWTALGRQTASMRLSDEGAPALPQLSAVWRASRMRPLARVLWETDEPRPTPIVVTQLVGAGQVRLQLTDELYRLQSFDGRGTLFERYWLQCIRELARGKRRAASDGTWSLDVDGDTFSEGTSVAFSAKVEGAPDRVRVSIRSRNVERMVELRAASTGTYLGSVDDLPSGSYRAVLVEPVPDRKTSPAVESPNGELSRNPISDTFVVQDAPSEQDRLQSDFAALRAAAEQSGGTFLTAAEAQTQRLDEAIPKMEPIRTQPLPPLPLWNHPLTAALLFSCLVSEWILRRRWGML